MDFLEASLDLLEKIWKYGILCIAVITFVIFIHEMGHYLAARIFGVRPELFSVGFGRELLGRTDRNGTRWSLRLVPFGGYVRLYGERETPELLTDPPEEIAKAFYNKPLSQRAMIVAAGPAINFLFAVVLFTALYGTLGRPQPDAVIYALEVDGPADKAGMKIGDKFLSVNGIPVRGVEHIKALMADKTGTEVSLEVERDGQVIPFKAVPKDLEEDNSYGFKTHRGTLSAVLPVYGFDIRQIHSVDGIDTEGHPDLARKLLQERLDKEVIVNFGKKKPTYYRIRPLKELNNALYDPEHQDYHSIRFGDAPIESMRKDPPWDALREGLDLTWQGINRTLGTIFQVVTGSKGAANELGGVIKIGTLTGDIAARSIFSFLTFVALLSVNIGLINLLPIPMLDGGHLLFYGIEAAKGSPVSPVAKGYTYGFGLIFMLLLIFFINVNDFIFLLSQG